jgi:CDP-4-dehydro-6-deoxyglucose reductase
MNDTATILGITPWGDDVFSLRLERQGLSFAPGDCLALYAEDGLTSRPYSIASGPDDPDLDFLIRRIPGGAVSDGLATRRPGDRIRVSPPFGWFRPADPPQAPKVFFATGTGISPFLSAMRAGSPPPRQLFFGVRHAANLIGLDLFPGECHACVSREACPGTHRGRLTDLLDRVWIDPAAHYYACGLDTMIDGVMAFLEGQGIAPTHLHRECFFTAAS